MQELKAWRHLLVGQVRMKWKGMRRVGKIVGVGHGFDPERLAEIRAPQEADRLAEIDTGFFAFREACHDGETIAPEADEPISSSPAGR